LAEQIRISQNFIHNNVQCNAGYGVSVNGTGYALVDRNVFDYDRHDVTGDGSLDPSGKTADPHGYIAELNFILRPGPTCDGYYNQHFDQHGSCCASSWNGGWAGQYIKIADNAIRGAQSTFLGFVRRPAFELRGTPSDRDIFANNAVVWGSGQAVYVKGPIRASSREWASCRSKAIGTASRLAMTSRSGILGMTIARMFSRPTEPRGDTPLVGAACGGF
jgi:hypothetical protein